MTAANDFIASSVDARTQLEERRQAIVDRFAAELADLAKDDYAWQRFNRGCLPEAAIRETLALAELAADRAETIAREEITARYLDTAPDRV